MAKKRDDKIQWFERISIGRVFSALFMIFTIIIMVSFFGFIFLLIFGPVPSGNIAVIHIDGAITSGEMQYFDGTSSDRAVKLIKSADSNPEIKAIILDINSGGGSPVASDDIASAVKSAEKPVVAVIREVGASGAYWVASAADRVYANRMSITGSIGVIGDYLEFSKFIQDYNVTYRLFTSGKYKAMGSPFKEMTNDEAEIFQKIVDTTYEFFVKAVAENRNIPEEKVRELATGEVFLGVEAKELGLIDELGSRDDAVKYIEGMMNITAELAEYSERASIYDLISSMRQSAVHPFVPGNEESKLSLTT